MRFVKAFVFVILVGGVLWFFWTKYSYFGKTQGPSEQVEVLDKLETSGAPDFSLNTITGEKFRLHDLRANLIIVNFWATWCAPCVTEYPAMLRMVEHFKAKVALVAINVDEDRKDLDSFLKIYGEGTKDVIHIWDPSRSLTERYGIAKLPETYIFDSKFKLIRKVPGQEEWDSEHALKYLEDLTN